MAQLISGTTIAGYTALHTGNIGSYAITSLSGYATQSYVTTQISNLINGAPGALDTLNELAAALGNDASFSSTITNSLAAKLALIGGTMTGNINWTQTDRGLTWGMNTDGAYIKFFNTGDGDVDSRLEYSTSDNGDEYHRWMISSVEKMTLKGDGLRVANTIYASGGNSGNWNTAYGWGNHASAGYLTTATAATTYASLTGSYANPSWITSLAYSKITGVPAFLTSYTETDTLNSVTGRGATTSNTIQIGKLGIGRAASSNESISVENPEGSWLIQGYRNGTAIGGLHTNTGILYVQAQSGASIRFETSGDVTWGGNIIATRYWVTSQGYLTGITSGQVTTALGYTPYNSTNPSGYITGITSGMVTTALGYTPANSSHNHDGVYVRAYTTTNDNIDSDWGQSFKTFDPVPSGTPPIASPNLRTINIGENFSRRTQLAFNYATDQAWFRRNQDGAWYSWREFFHTGNFTDNSSNWNTAYNKRPTAISFSGTGTKTLTLTQGDGSTLTASFSDIDTNTDAQTLSLSGNTLSISGGNSVTLSSSGLSQATADGLYVAKAGGSTVAGITYFSNGESINLYGIRGRYSGDGIHLYGRVDIGNPSGWGAGIGNAPTYGLSTFGGAYFAYNQGTVSIGALGTAKLHVIGNTSGQELFAVDGVNGRLFSVVDDLSDSLYSVNTIAGLPVLEVFANNIVTIGKFGTNAIYVGQDGRVGFGTTDFSYTAADQTSPTNNRLFVNGSIQLLGNNDAIVFGRGTATVLRDEKLAFGWGSGWYMEDADYLRVLSNKTVYSGGSARFDSYIYIGGASYYLYQANSGIWTNGNLGASGDLYLGTRGTWLSSWLNQNLTTGASPTFNDIYADNWFRNNGSNEGLYNQSTTQHWSSNTNGYWDASSTTSVSAIRFYTGGHVTSLRGYVYANSSNEIGFLNSAGNWGLRMDNSYNVQIYGTLSATNFSGSHSGTSSGTNTGDQTNISGNAATATNVAWTGVTGRPTALSQFTNDLGNYGGWITSESIGTGNTSGVVGAKYQINDTWLRVNSDNRQFQIYGNSRSIILRTDGVTNDHGGGAYAYIFYYGDSSDASRKVIFGTNGDIYMAYAGDWISTLLAAKQNSSTAITTSNIGSQSVNYASTVGINYNNDSNSTYQMLWGSGNSVYGTAGVYVNPNSDTIYSGGLRGSSNVGGTGEATWHPAGIYSGGTEWLYGHMYRNQSHTYGQGYIYQDGNYGYGLVGLYASTRFQAIFAMGDSYKQAVDGTGLGTLYGLSWTHSNVGGQGSYVSGHQLLVVANGQTLTAISTDIWARGNISANGGVYDSGSRVAISRGEGRNYVDYSRYVYNNGAYSGTGWTEPSDLGVRYANTAGSAPANGGTSTYATYLNPLSGDGNYKLAYTANGARTNAGEWGRAVMYYVPNGQTYGIRVDRADYADGAGSVAWSNVSGRPTSLSEFSNNLGNYGGWITSSGSISGSSGSTNAVNSTGWGNGNFTWYQTPSGLAPYTGSWASFLVSNHGDGSNYYNQTIIMPFWGAPQYSRREGGNNRGPWTFWTTENLDPNSISGNFYASGTITAGGDVVAYSDIRLKTNIKTIENALDKTLALRGVSYNRIDSEDNKTKIGVIAQETLEVIPEVVNQDANGMYNVSYGNMTALLIEAIKEQQAQIEELKSEVKKLRGE